MNSMALQVNRDVHSEWSSLKDKVLGGHDSIASLALDDLYEDCPQGGESHHASFASAPPARRHSTTSASRMSHGQLHRRRRRAPDHQSTLSVRSARSVNLDGSVSFSSTKLGQLLNSSGFKVERDFEVDSICPELAQAEAQSRSPRSPRRGSCGRPQIGSDLLNSPVKPQTRSPRSPRRGSCGRSQGPRPSKYSNVSSNEGVHHHDVGRGRISPQMKGPQSPRHSKSDLWRSRLAQSHDIGIGKLAPPMKNSPLPRVDMSKTKLGKMLTQQGLKLHQGPNIAKEKSPLVSPARTRKPTIRRERKRQKEEEPARSKPTATTISSPIVNEEPALAAAAPTTNTSATPTRNDSRSSSRLYQNLTLSLSESETASTTTNSDSSEDSRPAATVAPTVVEPTVVSNVPITAEPVTDVESFVPIHQRVPVKVLKDLMKQKAAKKQEMINKIKLLDAKLSTMLTACHEASRKLKMMEEDVSEVSEFTEISDVSEY